MRVITREFELATRSDRFTLIPIGDVHIGMAACDEDRFVHTVQRVARDPRAYWIGMGDYVDGVNRSDPRFDPAVLATWMKPSDLTDIAKAQRDRFLSIVKPIASKCLALVEGNHETAVKRHYERDIYSEIVAGVKEAGGLSADAPLAIGYAGWLILKFRRSKTFADGGGGATSTLRVYLHHGHGGGKLAGGKALTMERTLLTTECDLALMGHVHSSIVVPGAVQGVDGAGKPVLRKRRGAYTGTFLRHAYEGQDTYSEIKGYLPGVTDHIEVHLRPGADHPDDRLRLMTGGYEALSVGD